MEDDSKDRRRGEKTTLPASGHAKRPTSGVELAGLGVQLLGAILVFTFLGSWLDDRLGSSPWLLILGVFTGAGGGFYSIYGKLTAAPRKEGRRKVP